MSEHTNGQSLTNDPQMQPALRAAFERCALDCSGLARAIETLSTGEMGVEACVALLQHELMRLQQQAGALQHQLSEATIALRRLRETAKLEVVQKQDEQEQLQNGNDRFVANLIQEHESELAAVRRERDAAMDRVRELSRELNRSSGISSPGLPRVSNLPALRGAVAASEVDELRGRVEELLRERERSVRLLRQVAEQRDRAERRLRETRAADSRPAASSRSGSGISVGKENGPARRTRTATEPYISTPPWQSSASTIPPAAENPKPESPNNPAPREAQAGNPAEQQPSSRPVERAGTYTMRAEDLAPEAVFVVPSGKRRPKTP